MKQKFVPFYPFIFPIYAVLLLLANNTGEVEFQIAIRPAIALFLFTSILFAFFRMIIPDIHMSSLATFLLSFILFSYGHIYEGLKSLNLLSPALVRHRFLLPTLLVMLLGLFFLIKRAKIKSNITLYLNASMIVLILLPSAQLINFSIKSETLSTGGNPSQVACDPMADIPELLPDIYIFIMDAYEREDVLAELHGFDNSPFLDWLEAHGFYIAAGSLSNYRHTELSIASMLNMNYIQSFPDRYSIESNNRMGIIGMISDNLLRHELACLGYKTVAIDSGLFWTNWQDADYFLTQSSGPLDDAKLLGRLTNFEALLFETTIGRAYLDTNKTLAENRPAILTDQFDEHRARILFSFDQLEEVSKLPALKLVFIHILSPHPPMVFGPNGETVNYANFNTTPATSNADNILLKAYADQVQFLNTRLQEVIGNLLTASESPPIIIIQGDHGWADRNHEDKLSILNAYHLPGFDVDHLYPQITPVNSFRLILANYFNADYDLLPDISYYSSGDSVFQFEIVENTWDAKR
ncbi:MAG: hypothetical protein E4G99_06085 [Anaerolineales bacterium]|nr:MAG: hypothetical protein E4G99_06085 [Anaerolineales bacterium]